MWKRCFHMQCFTCSSFYSVVLIISRKSKYTQHTCLKNLFTLTKISLHTYDNTCQLICLFKYFTMFKLNVETMFPHTMHSFYYALFSKYCLHAFAKVLIELLFRVSTFNVSRLLGPLHRKLFLY